MDCQGVWRLPDTGQTGNYTATFGEDSDYQPAATQPSYTVNADNTITDNRTGLMWRRCSQGQNNDATCSGTAGNFTWENALISCENETTTYTDWRLPNVRELMSIVHYGAASPSINTTAFPGTASNWYWTSSTDVLGPINTWFVNFDVGGVGSYGKTGPLIVRCVRDTPISTYTSAGCAFPDTDQSQSFTATFGEDHDYASSASTMSFTVYNFVGISSVTVDNRTGLMWITNHATDAGMGGTYTWEGALSACEGLSYAGYTDWRLPNVRELMSIVHYGAASPSINTTAFPGTASNWYWTSSTYVPNTNNAWGVESGTGGTANVNKPDGHFVRCVRGGP